MSLICVLKFGYNFNIPEFRMAERPQNAHVLSSAQVLNLERVASSIRSKDHFHECLVRFGYHLPSSKASACTLKYLDLVKARRVWCPLTTDIRLKACPRQPPLKVLLQLLAEMAEEDDIELGFSMTKIPDAGWILDVLSTYRPDCYIFDKSYIPGIEKPIEVNNAGVQRTVDNADGFWSGQPILNDLKGKGAVKSGYSVVNKLAGDKIDD